MLQQMAATEEEEEVGERVSEAGLKSREEIKGCVTICECEMICFVASP